MTRDVLHHVLTASPEPVCPETVHAWCATHQQLAAQFPDALDLALVAGFTADRLAFGFASAHQSAARAAMPQLPKDRICAVAAIEGGRVHPRTLETRLTSEGPSHALVRGQKPLVKLGTAAQVVAVLAREGTDRFGDSTCMVLIDVTRAGVTLSALPAFPFAPEVPSGALRLEDVQVTQEEVLLGEGHAEYFVPFRALEDLHQEAALTGYLLQVARRTGWPQQCVQGLLAVAASLKALALLDPTSRPLQVGLMGAMKFVRSPLIQPPGVWDRAEAETQRRWNRDLNLLEMLDRDRARRFL